MAGANEVVLGGLRWRFYARHLPSLSESSSGQKLSTDQGSVPMMAASTDVVSLLEGIIVIFLFRRAWL
jgi:hypothetical protein